MVHVWRSAKIHQLLISFSLLGCLYCETSCSDLHLHSVDLWLMEVFVIVRRKPTPPVHPLNQLLSSLMNFTDSSWTQVFPVAVQVFPRADALGTLFRLEGGKYRLGKRRLLNCNRLQHQSFYLKCKSRSQIFSSHGSPSRFLHPCKCDVNLYFTNEDCTLKITLSLNVSDDKSQLLPSTCIYISELFMVPH